MGGVFEMGKGESMSKENVPEYGGTVAVVADAWSWKAFIAAAAAYGLELKVLSETYTDIGNDNPQNH